MRDYLQAVHERVVVFDGATGTNLHARNLTIDDYGGPQFEGCPEILNVVRPDVITDLHATLFDVGCDVATTNSFGGISTVLVEYGIPERAYELSNKAALLAREVADSYDGERFVAGDLGPGTKMATLGWISFAELRDAYEEAARGLLDGLFMLPLGVSAVTLGFGFLITLDRPPVDFRDSLLLVPIAQALVALPLVVRTLAPVLGGVDDRQRQAAASLGAGPLRAFLTVDLPAMWKPLLAAAGFAFAVSLGEFGATSFLAREDRPTLPIVIFHLIGHPGAMNYGMALAASVVLAGTTALVMLLVERLRVPSVGSF